MEIIDEKKFYVTQLFLCVFDIRAIESRISRESWGFMLEPDIEKMFLQAFAFCDEIRSLFDKKKSMKYLNSLKMMIILIL